MLANYVSIIIPVENLWNEFLAWLGESGQDRMRHQMQTYLQNINKISNQGMHAQPQTQEVALEVKIS